MAPSLPWLFAALAMLVSVALLQVARLLTKWCCKDRAKEADRKQQQDRAGAGSSSAPQEEKTPQLGYITVVPTNKALQGDHTIELSSTELRSGHECGWWLCQHTTTQMATLEKQVNMEVAAIRALRSRRLHHPGAEGKLRRTDSGRTAEDEGDSQVSGAGDDSDVESSRDADLVQAMQVIHRRTLEGFVTWCNYVSSASITSLCRKGLDLNALRDMSAQVMENSERPPDRLFVEALVLRVMESVGEQALQCPERLAYLLFHIYQEAGGLCDLGPTNFTIDMDKLHDGLVQMNLHTNPYTRYKFPNGKKELGLNFDDINESGIQCRDGVTKTFKEPVSLMVVVDFLLCYRVPIMLKLYCLALSGYIFLGSHQGDDITTTHNGSMLAPKWLRINFLQYLALLDAFAWALIEASLILYVAWQRWPSLGYRSPGVPGLRFMLNHLLNMCISVFGGLWVFAERNFQRKPWECAESDVGDVCHDPRVDRLFDVLKVTLLYWACRVVIFVLMNGKVEPIFLYGTPDRDRRRDSGRGWYANFVRDLRVNLAWVAMLGTCILAEVCLLLPTIRGLDWSTTCGLDVFGDVMGLPASTGFCSESTQETSFQCLTCLASVGTAWQLVLISSMVDIYFVFYVASAIVGGFMGHHRHLNDLKNTSLPIDLREHHGREALLFEHTFGPGWQHVWRVMVRGLHAESLISPKQAQSLAQAGGVTLDEDQAPTTQRSRVKNQKPIHLTRFPALAAERLAFFFQSLKSIEEQSLVKASKSFEPSTDALTGINFDPGSIPSLTQIIPAYNEVVIPSAEFLRSGAEPDDAKNGSPDDQPGLGDLTLPPQGDGVNTNLAFMISQFPDEWVFLTKRLHAEGWIETAESQDLYSDFIRQRLNHDVVVEVRMWTAMRMQSVAKTVIGALQYGRALASLPKIKQWYAQYPEKRVAEDHVEVILAHQTYGHVEGSEKNDEAVQLLLEKYADDALYLVFDLKKGSSQELWRMVENFFREKGGFSGGAFEQASVKCKWDKAIRGLRVLEVLPRRFQLRLGQGDYKTQGKACNQLNGLRFATGHYVQALDCNMGTFIGEGFKVPYVLRMFMPLDKDDRTAPKCRYLGFREYIYTGREGTVGQCHAAAEWTFGTINQRFLSGMGTRMHYGHPDFLDGFWARNRGGMSKSSPVVNLSEDIFAGYNVRMREEASPHIDFLEFEKGREATFNAASNFFSKISGGSISVIRSRDNHLLCERVGILHSLSFYFASVSFYVSNLLVDVSIYLYVILFILFSLTGIGPGQLAALGSFFHTEWIISIGLVTLVPQLVEIVLEFGAVHAFRQVFGGLFAATFFFIFQNKNIASSMKEGAMTGIARYFFTGRPMANQHQSWRDIYTSYWKSHYKPAFFLATAYVIYTVLAVQNGNGKLPMVLVVLSFTAWIVTPILFSPLPRWNLIGQDLREFNSFITGGAGSAEGDIDEVVSRGKKGTVRSLYECGLSEELVVWSEQHPVMLALTVVIKAAVGCCVLAVLPAEILDFLPLFVVVLGLSWVVIFGYFAAGLNNVFLVLSFMAWFAAIPFGHVVIGSRWCHPNAYTRLPEYVISLAVFLYFLGLAKEIVLLLCRALFTALPCSNKKRGMKRLHECVRMCFVYFFVHQLHTVEAWLVLVANLLVSVVVAAVDQFLCNMHTWFLLNRELARTKHGERYMEKSATFFELDRHRLDGSDLWWSDSESEVSAEHVSVSVHGQRSVA